LLIRNANRNLIVDASEVVYATIEDGLITVVAGGMEGQSNYRTSRNCNPISTPRPSGACTARIW